MKATSLRPEFVEFIPEEIPEGVLFVSIPYATAAHLCACGCNTRVVTPLTPTDWEIIFDGETVSLYPSIGNWSFPCQSHYWIRRNRIKWAKRLSKGAIEAGRARDRNAKQHHFDELDVTETSAEEMATDGLPDHQQAGLRARLFRLVRPNR